MNSERQECEQRTIPALADDVSRDEDVDPGEEGGEGALPPQLHLYIEQEVARLRELALQVDGAGVGVELPGAEVAALVAVSDADDDVVAGEGGRRTHAEDQRRDDDVGLEAELVVRDPQRQVLALGDVHAADSLTASAREKTAKDSVDSDSSLMNCS